MPKPLQFGDPGELGPFRLDSRLAESPAGIVYLGSDPQGRPVEVALLTTSSAGDAAARDRFREAVSAESPRPGAVPGEVSPVLASFTEGAAPWVATAYEEGRPGAERFLEPVLLKRGWGGVRRRRGGPQFQPYWMAGPRGPALQPVEPVAAPAAADSKGLATAVISLAALLALLAILVLLLFSCEPSDPKPPQPTEPPVSTQPVPQPPPPSPSVRPTPTPGKSDTRTPRPSQSGGPGTENPAGMTRP